ncbi:MAG TPA: alpha/beta fold hydrolase [Solirubrobacter sp.]|nr:alpha/beta fold hydrolase [Solirubrobacter sp.]
MALRALQLTKLMLRAHRAPLTRTPAEAGLAYQDVAFPAADGVELRGWFVPAGDAPGPAVVFVHGWLWNRLGNVAGQTVVPDRDVDFLPAVAALHRAGFHVLLFEWRRHGESASGRGPLTYGPVEAQDFVGAVRHLRSRPEVDGERIGVIGTSAGGNIALYGTPDAQPIKAVLAIQPTRVTEFNANFARTELGAWGPALIRPIDLLYALLRAPRPSRQDPAIPARALNGTVVRYVQGTGDPWGSIATVERIAAATPHTDGPVIHYPSTERYSGYRYISECVDEIVEFFSRHV